MTAKGKTRLIWDINAAKMHAVCGNYAAAKSLLVTINRRMSRISAKEKLFDGIDYERLTETIKRIERACKKEEQK